MLLEFRLLHSPDIFWNHAWWSQKEEILRSTSSTSTSALDILMSESHFHATSTCCILSFSFIGGTSVCKFLQPFFLVTVRPTVAQSQRSCSTLNLWVPSDFRLFGFFEDKNGQEVFLRFCTDKKKIWQERKLSCNETTRLRTVRVHKLNITPQFALHVTTGGEF